MELRIGVFAFCCFPKLKFIVGQLIIAHSINCGNLLVKFSWLLLKWGQSWLNASNYLDLRQCNHCFNIILIISECSRLSQMNEQRTDRFSSSSTDFLTCSLHQRAGWAACRLLPRVLFLWCFRHLLHLQLIQNPSPVISQHVQQETNLAG